MLAIAVVPSAVLIIVGAIVSGYLIQQGDQLKDLSDRAAESIAPAGPFFEAMQEERRLTLQEMSTSDITGSEAGPALAAARSATDATLGDMATAMRNIADLAPSEVQQSITELESLHARLPAVRAEADAGRRDPLDVFGYYNQIHDVSTAVIRGMARIAPDPGTGAELLVGVDAMGAADGMSRSNALAVAAVSDGGFTPEGYQAFFLATGSYHGRLAGVATEVPQQLQQFYADLRASEAWRQVADVERVLTQRGLPEGESGRPGGAPLALPVDVADWQGSAHQVSDQLLQGYFQQLGHATTLGGESADATTNNTVVLAGFLLLAAVVAFLVALRLSNGLVGRLERLREETLDLADERLPRIVGRLRAGRVVDLDEEVAPLDHGTDEIGQVAEAFNTAQHTAVSAAVQEAKTREGTKTVFLNIAHRTQVIVHKQLRLLDRAQRNLEDPEQLKMLYQLDHLATRARRHAENLIILGGGKPGRRWRNPVHLVSVARGAIAEVEDYTLISIDRLPDISIAGSAVADVVHLFAELFDNATTFSPPGSQVRVSGDLTGDDLAVEVEDQGLGIEHARLAELNATLRDPPDYSAMALPDEPRLGLFVVAQLAERHGISVTLQQSPYGGVRAVVIIPAALLAAESPSEAPTRQIAAIVEPRTGGSDTGRRAPSPTPTPGGRPAPGDKQAPRALPTRRGGSVADDARPGGTSARPSSMPGSPPAPQASTAPGPSTVPRPSHTSGSPGSSSSTGSNTSTVPGPPSTSRIPTAPGAATPDTSKAAGAARPAGSTPGAEPAPRASTASDDETTLDATQAPRRTPVSPNAIPVPGAQPTSTENAPVAPGVRPAPGGNPGGAPPPLPKRRGQRNLAPQLDNPPETPADAPPATHSAEQSRDRMAAFMQGTRRARQQREGE